MMLRVRHRMKNAVFSGLSISLLCSAPAFASLGGSVDSAQADRGRLHAQIHAVATGSRTLHTITLANGGSVKEMTNASGVVYALSWSGPGKPDLRQLLGPHFDTFQQHAARISARHSRAPALINQADVVIQTGGHPGAFWGVAYLPSLVPAGFSVDQLQ